jgi:hypothetical protein
VAPNSMFAMREVWWKLLVICVLSRLIVSVYPGSTTSAVTAVTVRKHFRLLAWPPVRASSLRFQGRFGSWPESRLGASKGDGQLRAKLETTSRTDASWNLEALVWDTGLPQPFKVERHLLLPF